MGMEDRDWYREKYVATRRSKSRSRFDGEWHWATQTLVWLAVAGLLFFIFRIYERRAAPKQLPLPTASQAESAIQRPQLQPRIAAPLAAPTPLQQPAEVTAAPARAAQPQSIVSTIYLCQSYGGGKFWSSTHCQQSNALIDRMETVPSNMPFEQQVALARQQRDDALSLSLPAPVRQQAPSTLFAQTSRKAQCDALDAEVQHWDAMARAPQSAQMQDWISNRRKTARDAPFRLRC